MVFKRDGYTEESGDCGGDGVNGIETFFNMISDLLALVANFGDKVDL